MTAILAIETATEACSVALWLDGAMQERYAVTPRQHSQRLFPMLASLLPDGNLRAYAIDAIAYGSGPGSFTGLRIAASAVQGLAFAHGLPVVPVSTLACLAQRALREGLVAEQDRVFSTLDAAVGEVYYAEVSFRGGVATVLEAPRVARPEDVRLPGAHRLVAVGSGCRFLDEMPAALTARFDATAHPGLLPAAQDLVPAALTGFAEGAVQAAEAVAPVYVRDEISWKKIADQVKAQR
jgi:tRNA threonylcarbamoyladenosine biosynthesis protein TsaB